MFVPLRLIDRTEFKLPVRILGEGVTAIRPVLQQRQDLGYNCARVFSQTDIMWSFHPALVPDYDGLIRRTIETLLSYGSYINLVCYVDERNVQSGPGHWERLGRLMQSYPGCGILSVGNEVDQPVNAVPFLAQLPKIDGVICTRGSNGGSATPPPMPHMDAGEEHTNTEREWWREDHNAMEDIAWKASIPSWVSERPRPDQDGNLGRHADSAGIGALLCAGATFHCTEGKYSDVYGPSLPFAAAFAQRMLAIPQPFITGSPTIGMSPSGQYSRPEDPSVLRRYRKTLPDGRSHEETARLP